MMGGWEGPPEAEEAFVGAPTCNNFLYQSLILYKSYKLCDIV